MPEGKASVVEGVYNKDFITEAAFISTTVNSDTGAFSGPVLLEITGTSGVDVSSLSTAPKEGELLYHFGTYAVSGGQNSGGFQRPHQMDVGPDGTLYVTSWDGGWLTKLVPRPDADPAKLVGRRLRLAP